jgi:branched-chain amino acid transport system permease protein
MLLAVGNGNGKRFAAVTAVSVIAAALLVLLPRFGGQVTISLLSRIFILAVFGMSYDILRGFTGVINLGQAMFFGSGTYLVGILCLRLGPTPATLLLAVLVTVLYCSVAAFIMGKIAFRGGGVIACAMITLALGEIVRHLAETWRDVTMGADGLTFPIPYMFRERMLFYYYALLFLILMVLALRRFVLSPAGRVLLAIRENEQRAIFLGYNTTAYKMISLQVGGISAGLAGVMFALLTRFANTELLTIQQTLNALLVTIVGGTGTLYGAIVGTAFVQLIQHYLLTLRGVHPIFTRWLLFFGSIYVLVVLYMPSGIIGAYRQLAAYLRNRQNRAAAAKGEALQRGE